MKLKQYVFNESKKYDLDISPESLAALVLYTFSKESNFKDNYAHLELISNGDEIRLYSTPLNNISGATNSRMSDIIIQSNPEDYYNDSYYDAAIEKKTEIVILSDDKMKRINEFFEKLEASTSMKEFVGFLNKNREILIDIHQNVLRIDPYNDSKSGLINMVSIASNLFEHKDSKGFYRISNDSLGLSSMATRDALNSNGLGNVISAGNSKEYIKRNIDNIRPYEKIFFINENTGKIEDDIQKMIDDPNIDNFKIFKKIRKNKKYANKFVDIALSMETREEKSLKISEIFFEELKQDTLEGKQQILSVYKSSSDLLDKYSQQINEIITNFKLEYNFEEQKQKREIIVKEFEPVGQYDDYELSKFLASLNKCDFYSNENTDMIVTGMGFCTDDNFSYMKQRKAIVVGLKNDNELLAVGNFYIQDATIRINSVNVVTHRRGENLIQDVYKEIIDYAKKQNMPLLTSMYTRKGSERLPKLKRKLLSEDKDVLWLESCSNMHQTELESMLSHMSEGILRGIREKFQGIKMSEVRTIYDEEKQKIGFKLIGREDDFSLKYKLQDEFQKNFFERLDNHYSLHYKSSKNPKI